MHFCIAVFPGWLCFNQKHVLRIAVFPEVLFWFVEVSIHPVANKSTACSSNYSLAIIVITMTMKMTTTTTMMMMIMMMMIKTMDNDDDDDKNKDTIYIQLQTSRRKLLHVQVNNSFRIIIPTGNIETSDDFN